MTWSIRVWIRVLYSPSISSGNEDWLCIWCCYLRATMMLWLATRLRLLEGRLHASCRLGHLEAKIGVLQRCELLVGARTTGS